MENKNYDLNPKKFDQKEGFEEPVNDQIEGTRNKVRYRAEGLDEVERDKEDDLAPRDEDGMAEDFEDPTYDVADEPPAETTESSKDKDDDKNLWEKMKDKAENLGDNIKRAFD